MRIRAAALTILALLGLSACSADTGVAVDSKYQQTWTTPYTDTTCADYLTAMTSKQRWAMAADMLTSARKVDGSTTLPVDAVVTRFESDMTTACQGEATVETGDVAVLIYKMDSSYQP